MKSLRPIDDRSSSLSSSTPDAGQSLPDFVAHAFAIVGIQRGLQGMYQGTGEDAEDTFASLERELGVAEQT